MTINDAKTKQNEFNLKVDTLNDYFPRLQNYIDAKNSLLNTAKNFYKGREKIIEGFEKKKFCIKMMYLKQKKKKNQKKKKGPKSLSSILRMNQRM